MNLMLGLAVQSQLAVNLGNLIATPPHPQINGIPESWLLVWQHGSTKVEFPLPEMNHTFQYSPKSGQ